jgi:formamidopyrimidine-DNA glycosylase
VWSRQREETACRRANCGESGLPELPEVETIKRGLEPILRGHRIVRVELRRADLRFPFPKRFAARLEGRRIARLDRRAKYLLAYIDGGDVLVMHLGMSGRFRISLPGKTNIRPDGDFSVVASDEPKHDHVVFTTSAGAIVTYNDARRFGYMLLIREKRLNQHALFSDLGVEPLSDQLTPKYLAIKANGKKVDLKAFLMDQRIVAGLGNIYVCEILFRAGLSPEKRAAQLVTRIGMPTAHAMRIVTAIKSVLEDAIEAGGSTLRDYRHADGTLGYFQQQFDVYGREGQPCTRAGCPGTVGRKIQGGRSTFACSACQR